MYPKEEKDDKTKESNKDYENTMDRQQKKDGEEYINKDREMPPQEEERGFKEQKKR